jgi:hypothetical protein
MQTYQAPSKTSPLARIFTGALGWMYGMCPQNLVSVLIAAYFIFGFANHSRAALIADWQFQNNVNDSAGAFNATAFNSPTYSPGIIGQAIRFNGINQYATVPAMGTYASITLSTWIQTVDADSPGSQAIFHSSKYENGTPHFLLEYGRNNTITGIVIDIKTAEIKLNGASSPIHENTWYHVAFTYLESNRSLKLFINGVEVGSATSGSAVLINLNDMLIGSGFDRPFNGLIDDMGVWDEALSADKVKGIGSFASSVLNYGQSDVAKLYGLTEGQSTTTSDLAEWEYATGLSGTAGELQFLGGGLYAMNLGGGTGVKMIPEPSITSLLFAGLLGWFIWGRYRSNKLSRK